MNHAGWFNDLLRSESRRCERVAGVPNRLSEPRRAPRDRVAGLRPGALLPGQLIDSSGRPMRRGARRPSNRYTLGNPGRPAEVPTLLITIFDNSGSVSSPAGNDPLSNRFAEVRTAFSVVARKGARHELGAVLHFDTPTSADVHPVPITRFGQMRLRAGLQVPPDGAGCSELGPSLRRAVELADSRPEHEVTLVVLSDFLLLDADRSQVLKELATFRGQVHAVILGGSPYAEVLDKSITVTTVEPNDPPGAVARALFASLTTYRPGRRLAAS